MSKLFYKTERGGNHSVNQDFFLTMELCFFNDAKIRCLILADGMGGESRGEQASRTAVNAFADSFYIRLKKKYLEFADRGKRLEIYFNRQIMERIILDAVRDANRAVRKEIPSMMRSGTTLSAAVLINSCLMVVNVGDSPIYYYSEQEDTIRCVSKIMNRAEESAELGEIERYSDEYFEISNLLTGSLGRYDDLFECDDPGAEKALRLICLRDLGSMEEGDFLILGSDGAFGHLRPEEFKEILLEENGSQKLTELFANAARGAEDDRTAILYMEE